MNVIEELMSRRWISKKDNTKLYYQVKDNAKEIQSKLQDKFGYYLLINPHLVKLEKLPGKPEIWMGINDFGNIQQYQMFCFILMFLEDKDEEEQFVLSNLSEYIQVQFNNEEIDWTSFRCRKNLVNVIKYCVKMKLFLQDDGNEEHFLKNEDSEVLYENTGLSRYYIRSFSRDIMEFKQPSDFLKSEWFHLDEDRGLIRRQRVYRRLILSCGIYCDEDTSSVEDFNYIKNYRKKIESDFQSMFACDLHVHSSSAFVSLDSDCSMGNIFPVNNQCICDLLLISHFEIRKRLKSGQYHRDTNELIWLEKEVYQNLLVKIAKENIDRLPRKYQEIGYSKVATMIFEMGLNYGFIQLIESKVKIYPIIGKVVGGYHEKEVNL